MSKELIEQLAKEHGVTAHDPKKHGIMSWGSVNTESLEAFAKAYQAAAPIDNGILQEVIYILQSHIGSTSETPLSDAIAQVEALIPDTQAKKGE
jgi:hypothetical protein